MSYTYYLGRPIESSNPEKAISEGLLEPLGTHEEVWKKIEELCGRLRWVRVNSSTHPNSMMIPEQSCEAFHEISLHHDPVLVLSVVPSVHAEPIDLVPRLCKLLGVFAFDPQKWEIVAKP